MARRRLFWHLFPTYLFITLLALAAVGILILRSERREYRRLLENDLKTRAAIVVGQIRPLLLNERRDELASAVEQVRRVSGARVTIIDTSGVVLADSHRDPRQMENHASRPEVAKALKGDTAVSSRFSNTLQTSMTYAAVPIRSGERVISVVRTAVPSEYLRETSVQQLERMLLAIAIGLALAALGSLVVSRNLSGQIGKIRDGAQRFAGGELDLKLPVAGPAELAGLSETLNEMAGQLRDRIDTITRQKNEQAAILSSMIEGVIAVDTQERVIELNRAACDVLRLDTGVNRGRSIPELVRHIGFIDLVRKVLQSSVPLEREITLGEGDARVIQVYGSPMAQADGVRLGAVLVLNDVTRVRRLEKVRKEFVANVSHELKTPMTAVKGYVETLLDGAVESKEQANEFLKRVVSQVNRLNAIIDDLLTLAHLEQGESAGELTRERIKLAPLLSRLLLSFKAAGQAKQMVLKVSCPDSVEITANVNLLQQAVGNLVDNAVKYGKEGGELQVTGLLRDGRVEITVQDSGPGIEEEHLSRLFERFYRVDKGRSRQMGGTGLGLAIVKHIALAHGGRVSVTSAPGKGSSFTISLPAADPAK